MKDRTASVAKQRSRQQCGVLRSSENKALSQSKAIQHYYGAIAIAAVAAAVRYQGDFKNAAYAPVAIEWYDRRGFAVRSYRFRRWRKVLPFPCKVRTTGSHQHHGQLNAPVWP